MEKNPDHIVHTCTIAMLRCTLHFWFFHLGTKWTNCLGDQLECSLHIVGHGRRHGLWDQGRQPSVFALGSYWWSWHSWVSVEIGVSWMVWDCLMGWGKFWGWKHALLWLFQSWPCIREHAAWCFSQSFWCHCKVLGVWDCAEAWLGILFSVSIGGAEDLRCRDC